MARRNPVIHGVQKAVSEVPRAELMRCKRMQFSDEEWSDELDDEIRESIYEHDMESRARRNALEEMIRGQITDDDGARQMFLDADPQEYVQSSFEEWLDSVKSGQLLEQVRRHSEDELSEVLESHGEEKVLQALKNYHNYEFVHEEGDEYRKPREMLYGQFEGDKEEQLDRSNLRDSYDFYLSKVTGEMNVAVSPTDPFPDEVEYVVEDLKRAISDPEELAEFINETFSGTGRDFAVFTYSNSIDLWIGYAPDWEKIKEELGEPEAEAEAFTPPEDRVVYRFKDGFYIQDLHSSELDKEGSELGICVGRCDMPYERMVKSGKAKILSLRTAGGRPKLTIEAQIENGKITRIDQIKGYGNRQPGWANKNYDASKFRPTEVLMMAEWLESIGVRPYYVYDLQPGMKQLKARGELPAKWEDEIGGVKDVRHADNLFDNPGHHCGFCAPRSNPSMRDTLRGASSRSPEPARGILLFSYGSNHPDQLVERIGPIEDPRAAVAVGYSRVFRGWSDRLGGGTASLEKSRTRPAHGFVTRISAAQKAQLDRFEGVAAGKYELVDIPVVIDGGPPQTAKAYVSTSRTFAKPSREYLKAVAKTISSFWDSDPSGRDIVVE
jgi:hypothetical protein